MSFEVKNRETANITDPIDMNSKFSKKVDNSLTRIWKREPQYKWCCQDTEDFFEKYHDFQVVEGTKLSFYLKLVRFARMIGYLVRMQFAFPVAGTVMCILYDLSEHSFRFENKVLLRYHATADCKYSSE